MDDKELRDLIEQLHNEIQNTKSLDKKGQELLSHLDSDIRELLGQSGGEGVHLRQYTIQRLKDGLAHFEVTHPALTTLISNLLESLSNAGV
jgi:Domain of unknown function (DUF4404)